MKVSLIKVNKNEVRIIHDESFSINADAVTRFKEITSDLLQSGFVPKFIDASNGRRHKAFYKLDGGRMILSLY